MKGIRTVFNFYINASVHIAFAVLSLLIITGFFYSIEISNYLKVFVFCSSLSCYNFIKYGVEAKKYFLVVKAYHKKIQFLSILCLLVSVYCAYFLRLETLLGCVLFLMLTGVYAIPVLPKVSNFRNLGGYKIVPVALVWSGVTVLLPFFNLGLTLTWDLGIEVLQRFIMVLVLLIPFEIRDLKYDPPELQTLPQKFGVVKSKILGAYGVLIFFALTYFKDVLTAEELISKGALFLILGILMFVTKRNQNNYFASFWVEAIPIFWLGVVNAIYFIY